jgi:DNA-binding PadR family transcriptional regulator
MSVRHALLALLSEGPKYGLQLRQEFEARTGEVWPLNVGQVYSTVQRLERDGLVASDAESAGDGSEAGPQKGYRITPEGAAELAAWLRTPPEDDAPPRDELVIKVLVALRLPGVDVPAILQAHRRATIERMQRYTRLKEQAAEDMALLLVADAQLYRLESVVRWLDAAQARLRMRPEPAVPPAEQPAPEAAPGRTGAAR